MYYEKNCTHEPAYNLIYSELLMVRVRLKLNGGGSLDIQYLDKLR
jgi:hypothetical protein